MHIEMDDDLVRRIDAAGGRRQRSRFVREAVIAALEHRERWALIESVKGAIADGGHDWDRDPAAWVRRQRRGDRRRVG
jgi:predicted transcriptional regulator